MPHVVRDLARKLNRALEVGGDVYDAGDIAKAVREGRMQSWTEGDSLVVTEIMQYPKASAVNIVIAVGNLEEVMSLQPAIERFGREHGCKMLRMEGRQGWAKVLPSRGWTQDRKVIFERAI